MRSNVDFRNSHKHVLAVVCIKSVLNCDTFAIAIFKFLPEAAEAIDGAGPSKREGRKMHPRVVPCFHIVHAFSFLSVGSVTHPRGGLVSAVLFPRTDRDTVAAPNYSHSPCNLENSIALRILKLSCLVYLILHGEIELFFILCCRFYSYMFCNPVIFRVLEL